MGNLILTPNQISTIAKNSEIVGCGSYGVLYKLDEDKIIKFKYKDFIKDFANENREINLHLLGDISKSIKRIKNNQVEILKNNLLQQLLENNFEYQKILAMLSNSIFEESQLSYSKLKKLHAIEKQCNQENKEKFETIKSEYPQDVKYVLNAIAKQDKITHTNLPQGLVLVNDLCVGYLLSFNKNMEDLYSYMSSNLPSESFRKRVIENVYISAQELLENGIFHNDLTARNIMVNPKTGDIQIIDTDDIICLSENEMTDEQNKNYISIKQKEINEKLKRIEQFILAKVDNLPTIWLAV